MKKIIAFLLALLVLSGCSLNKPVQEEPPVAAEPITEEIPQPAEEQLDVPMTEEEAAAAEAAKAAELEERARTKSLPIGTFDAPTIDGDTLTEAVFAQAELTVINIWATYCSPCKEEMPILATLHEELSDDVQIVGLILDVTDEEDNIIPSQEILAKALIEEAGVTYKNMLLNQDLMNCGFGAISAVPATMFIDKDGNTVGQGFYGALDEAGWREVIAERLEIARDRY